MKKIAVTLFRILAIITFTQGGACLQVKASCGCPVTSYSKGPLETGSEGFVKATHNAASAGQFTKTVSIQANTDDNMAPLTNKGEVTE